MAEKLLRNKFNFKGLVISDDISMKALKDDMIDIVKKSYNAGCNVVLYCSGILDEMEKIYPYVKNIDLEIFKYFNKKCKNIKTKDLTQYKDQLVKFEIIKLKWN